MNFLRKLNRWLETAGDELSVNDWVNKLNYLQVSQSIDNERQRNIVTQDYFETISLVLMP